MGPVPVCQGEQLDELGSAAVLPSDLRDGPPVEDHLKRSRKNFPAMHEASLLRDDNLPGHFLSFAEWDNHNQSRAWKAAAGFQERFKACAAMCDKARGADYDRVAAV
jgi:quinol monooxygenase YgiN